MIEFKSDEEKYFSYYLDELKEAGFVNEWSYETSTFELCKPYSRKYQKQLKTKVVEKEEFLLHKSSITIDFTIIWDYKASNIFFLNGFYPISCDIKTIPFRLIKPIGNCSYIEIKPTNESTTTSSISFPLKQKQLMKDHHVYCQKIKPFDLKGKNCLFEKTFVPKKVLKEEVYKRDSKFGRKGESKFKFKTKSLTEFLEIMNYGS